MSEPERAVNGAVLQPDLSHVKGQEAAKRALEVAAAGDHPILLIGPAGSGKTLLARCLPGLLSPPTKEEVAEIAEVYRKARLEPPAGRPFRSPHFSTRPRDLAGHRKPGEVDLARAGALLLDDLPAFGRLRLRALRQAFEDHRGQGPTGAGDKPPSRFLLAATMRACPCGRLGDDTRPCSCAPWEVARYWAPVEELFLDLVHLHVEVPPAGLPELRSGPGETSEQVAERVHRARQRQLERPEQQGGNAHLRPWALPRFCDPDPAGKRLLDVAADRLGLRVPELGIILRVARTIADLAGCETIRAPHVAEAIQYRSLGLRRDQLKRGHRVH